MKRTTDKGAKATPAEKPAPPIHVTFYVSAIFNIPDAARAKALFVMPFPKGDLARHCEVIMLRSGTDTYQTLLRVAEESTPKRVCYGWNPGHTKEVDKRLTWVAWDEFVEAHFGKRPDAAGRPERFDSERAATEVTSLGAVVVRQDSQRPASAAKPKGSRKPKVEKPDEDDDD